MWRVCHRRRPSFCCCVAVPRLHRPPAAPAVAAPPSRRRTRRPRRSCEPTAAPAASSATVAAASAAATAASDDSFCARAATPRSFICASSEDTDDPVLAMAFGGPRCRRSVDAMASAVLASPPRPQCDSLSLLRRPLNLHIPLRRLGFGQLPPALPPLLLPPSPPPPPALHGGPSPAASTERRVSFPADILPCRGESRRLLISYYDYELAVIVF